MTDNLKIGDEVVIEIDALWKFDYQKKIKEQITIKIYDICEFIVDGVDVIKTYLNGNVTYVSFNSVIKEPKHFCEIPNVYHGEEYGSLIVAIFEQKPEIATTKYKFNFETY